MKRKLETKNSSIKKTKYDKTKIALTGINNEHMNKMLNKRKQDFDIVEIDNNPKYLIFNENKLTQKMLFQIVSNFKEINKIPLIEKEDFLKNLNKPKETVFKVQDYKKDIKIKKTIEDTTYLEKSLLKLDINFEFDKDGEFVEEIMKYFKTNVIKIIDLNEEFKKSEVEVKNINVEEVKKKVVVTDYNFTTIISEGKVDKIDIFNNYQDEIEKKQNCEWKNFMNEIKGNLKIEDTLFCF